MYPAFQPHRLFSHMLIVISAIVTLGAFIYQDLYLYGMNVRFLSQGEYGSFLVQIILYQFLHGNLLHLVLNGYFLYSAGPMVESRMSQGAFRLFFIGNTLFCMVALLLFSSSSNTIGISGFAMALLAYLFMDLRSIRHPMAGQLGIMLGINILIGFSSGISLTWHVAGAVFGYIWWLLMRHGLHKFVEAR